MLCAIGRPFPKRTDFIHFDAGCLRFENRTGWLQKRPLTAAGCLNRSARA